MNLGSLGLIVDDVWPVGKHKGTLMEDLPTHYLNWVVFESDISGPLLNKAKNELELRGESINYGDNWDGLSPLDASEDW